MKENMTKAWKITIPVMIGYLFLGIAFGLLCKEKGYSWLWAALISCIVYAGSMQFVLLSFLHSGASLVEVAFVTLSVNARQLFYGISCIDKFKDMGFKKWYMIFSLTDETYSLLCNMKASKDVNDQQTMFFVSLFDQIYWIIGSILGALLADMIHFNTQGIDFAMTALFTVIFVEQWIQSKDHTSAYLALVCTALCICIFKQDFLLPSLVLLTILLLFLAHKKEVQEHV